MANKPFDRGFVNTRTRPLSGDANIVESELDQTTRYLLRKMFSRAVFVGGSTEAGVARNGFVGDGLQVIPNPGGVDLSVTVRDGVGFYLAGGDVPTNINAVSGLNDVEPYKPVLLSTALNIPVSPAPAGGQERWDLIEVRYNRNPLVDTQSRDVLDPGTGAFTPSNVPTTLSWDVGTDFGTVTSPAASTNAISRKIGVPAAIGTALLPASTSGYQALAYVYIVGGATSIDYDAILPLRRYLAPDGLLVLQGSFKLPDTTGAPSSVEMHLPPGIRATVVSSGGAGSRAAQVVLLGVPTVSANSVTFTGILDGNDNANTLSVLKTSFTNATVDSAMQTALLNAAITSPQIRSCIGDAALLLSFEPMSQSGATTAQNFALTGNPAWIRWCATIAVGL